LLRVVSVVALVREKLPLHGPQGSQVAIGFRLGSFGTLAQLVGLAPQCRLGALELRRQATEVQCSAGENAHPAQDGTRHCDYLQAPRGGLVPQCIHAALVLVLAGLQLQLSFLRRLGPRPVDLQGPKQIRARLFVTQALGLCQLFSFLVDHAAPLGFPPQNCESRLKQPFLKNRELPLTAVVRRGTDRRID
jgi:hypothetical protein